MKIAFWIPGLKVPAKRSGHREGGGSGRAGVGWRPPIVRKSGEVGPKAGVRTERRSPRREALIGRGGAGMIGLTSPRRPPQRRVDQGERATTGSAFER